MKIPNAARFNVLIWLAVCLAVWLLLPGLRMIGVQFVRQAWLLDHPLQWMAGWWIWLLAIFGWMWLTVALAWTYLPAHRVASMLQSGLMLIGAILLIAGVVLWMGVLPVIAAQLDVATLILLIDTVALTLVGSGCLMGGIVTSWIGVELYVQRVIPRPWPLLCVVAGLSLLPSPFLFPLLFPYHLLFAALCWWLWSLYLALLPKLPSPFAEYLRT